MSPASPPASRLGRYLFWIREWLAANLAFVATAAIVAYVLFGVDQISHLWKAHLPGPKSPSAQRLFWLFGLALVVMHAGAFFHIAQWRGGKPAATVWPWHWITDWPLKLAVGRSPNGLTGAGLAFTLLGAVVLVWGASGQASRLYCLSGLACQNAGVLLLIAGAWMLLSAKLPADNRGLSMMGGIIGWLVITAAIGEIIWIISRPGGATWASYRLYTVWAIFELMALLLFVARWVDVLYASTPFPTRLVAGAAVAFAVVWWTGHDTVSPQDFMFDAQLAPVPAANPPMVGAVRPLVIDDTERALAQAWLDQFAARIERIPNGQGPAVFVAAAGGGSRAAAFAALTYDSLARTRLPGAGERRLAANVVLISSVSGGSLASAHFVQTRAAAHSGAGPAERDDLRYSVKSELLDFLRKHPWDEDFKEASADIAKQDGQQPTAWPDPAEKDFKEKLAKLQKEREGLTRHFQDPLSKIDASTQEIAQKARRLTDLQLFLSLHRASGGDPQLANDMFREAVGESAEEPWPTKSAGFDDMCLDFMAPILRGTLSLTFDRGDALARFWTRHYGWTNANSKDGYVRDGRVFYGEDDPVVMFNATDVSHGSRLVAGFPPLPPFLWVAAYDPSSGAQRPGVRRGRPRTVCETNPNLTLSLSRAVRLSSNFPFGFRISELPEATSRTAANGGARDRPTHVTDGGVVDNTGLDSVAELLFALRQLAGGTNTSPALAEFRQGAQRILDLLRSRGVLLIEIDTGAKPGPDSAQPGGGISEPLAALTNAGYSGAELTRERYLSDINAAFEDGKKPGDLPFRAYTFVCVRSQDAAVMTAWALGPEDKGKVLRSFILSDLLWQMQWPDLHRELTHPNQTIAASQAVLDTSADRKRLVEERSRQMKKR